MTTSLVNFLFFAHQQLHEHLSQHSTIRIKPQLAMLDGSDDKSESFESNGKGRHCFLCRLLKQFDGLSEVCGCW
jgi:hypothetical protein